MKPHLPALFACLTALWVAASTHGKVVINESDFGVDFNFSRDRLAATVLADPISETTVIRGGDDDDADAFSFTLLADATPVTLELDGVIDSVIFSIHEGLQSDDPLFFTDDTTIGNGLTVLPDLPAGDYTVFINDGGDYTYDFTLTVPEPASLVLMGLGGVACLWRTRRDRLTSPTPV